MTIYDIELINKIEEAKKGNTDAFGELYKLYSNYVYSIIMDFFDNHISDSEDLLQEIFLKAHTSLSTLNKNESFQNWLAGITLNVCREYVRDKNYLKNRATLVPIEDYEIEGDEKCFPEQVLENNQAREIVLHTIETLPSRQRLVMLLFYFQGFSYKEIEHSLELPISIIKKDLYRGRNAIKEELKIKLGIEERNTGISYGMIFMGYGNHMMMKETLSPVVANKVWKSIKTKIPGSKSYFPLKLGVLLMGILLIASGLLGVLANSEHQISPKPIATLQAIEAPAAPSGEATYPKEIPQEQVSVPGTHEKSPEITNTALVNGKPTNTVARTFENDTGGNKETPGWKNIMNTLPKTGGTRILILAFFLIGFGLMIQNKLNKLKKSEKRRKNVKSKKLFKKIGLWASIFAIIISAMVGSFSNGVKAEEIPPVPVTPATTAVDYSDQVEVLDWNILDANGIPLSETNIAKYYTTYQLWVQWELIPTNGEIVHEGDTFSIPLPKNQVSGLWTTATSSYENFTDASGVTIGQWRITNASIEVILSSNAEGSSSIEASFTTGKNAIRDSCTTLLTQNVTMGSVAKSISFDKARLGYLDTLDRKVEMATSNSMISWATLVNNLGICQLTKKEWGANFTEQQNVYFEDTLVGGTTGGISIYAPVSHPAELSTGSSSNDYYPINVTSKFIKVQQNLNESYADFKSRLKPFEYGIYQDINNIQTIVVYFGNIGNNGMTYESLDPNFVKNAASSAIYAGFYSESDRLDLENFYTQAFGNSNIISGNVGRYLIRFAESYDKVLVDTPKTNTAIITKNGVSQNYSATGTLQGNMGSASVSKNSAGVFLYDQDTNALLPNATFKVQYKNGANWEDYTSAGTLATDANGAAVTPALGLGTYRFVEVTPSSSDYDLVKSQGYDTGLGTVISGEFTIAATDVDGHKIPVSNVKKKYSVTYTKGDHGIFTDVLFSNIVINSMTPGYNGLMSASNEPLGETGYHFTGWDKTLLSTVTKDEVYTAQWDPNDYPITYVLDGGTNDSANPSTYTYGVGVDSFDNPTKTGYEFTGWYDAAIDGTEITNISITATGEKTLYARWIAEDYPINYILDGGTNDSTNPNNYTYGVGVDSFKDPTKTGYTFLGWYPSETDENLLTCILPTDQGEKTLYARWEKIADIFTSEKTVDIPIDKTVKAGDIMTYTIKTENSGVLDSDAVTISDTIPEGTTYVEGSATEGAVFDGTKLTLTKDSLAPGETLTLTFKVKVKEGVKTGDTITNVAKVNDQDTNQVETPAESSDVVVPGTKAVTTPEVTNNTPNGILPKTGGCLLIGLGTLILLLGTGLLIGSKRKKKIVN